MSAPLGRSTSTAPEWSAWPRGVDDTRGSELPITSGEVRLRYNDVSTFTCEIPFTPARWVAVGRGTRLEIRRHRATVINGSVVERELQVDAEHPGGVIVVTGESDEGLLADRLCYPNPAVEFPSQANGATYRQTAPGETVAKALVNLNAGPGALASRRVLGLTVEPDQGRGLTYLTILRYDNLLYTLQVLGRDWGPFGFRVDSSSGTGRVFRVYTPPDLSATVRFSIGLGNLAGLKYRESAPTATYAMAEGVVPAVMGKATDANGREYEYLISPEQPLRYAESTSDAGTLHYQRRAEVWSDAGGSIAGVSDLFKPVRDSLGAGTMTAGLVLDPAPDYLLDADPAVLLGAMVTVQVGPLDYTDTVSVIDVVREVRLVYDVESGTDTVTPTVGSDGATASMLAPQLGGLDRRLSQLERR